MGVNLLRSYKFAFGIAEIGAAEVIPIFDRRSFWGRRAPLVQSTSMDARSPVRAPQRMSLRECRRGQVTNAPRPAWLIGIALGTGIAAFLNIAGCARFQNDLSNAGGMTAFADRAIHFSREVVRPDPIT